MLISLLTFLYPAIAVDFVPARDSDRSAFPIAVDEDGTVLVQTAEHTTPTSLRTPALWTPATGFVPLSAGPGTSSAGSSIRDGRVYGWWEVDGQTHAAMWIDGEFIDADPLLPSSDHKRLIGGTASGIVLGSIRTDRLEHGYRVWPDGTIEALTPTWATASWGAGIAEDGTVAGRVVYNGSVLPARWLPNGTIDLGMPLSTPVFHAFVSPVLSSSGVSTFDGNTGEGSQIWWPGELPVPAPHPGGDSDGFQVRDVTNLGTMIGYSYTSPYWDPIWFDGAAFHPIPDFPSIHVSGYVRDLTDSGWWVVYSTEEPGFYFGNVYGDCHDADADSICDLDDTCIDVDADGVCDAEDVCPNTSLVEVFDQGLRPGRYGDTDGDGTFESHRGRDSQFTLVDTHGCNCHQLADALDYDATEGCSMGVLQKAANSLAN